MGHKTVAAIYQQIAVTGVHGRSGIRPSRTEFFTPHQADTGARSACIMA